MKVIELLNKIANGEEVPRKIKYRKIFINIITSITIIIWKIKAYVDYIHYLTIYVLMGT